MGKWFDAERPWADRLSHSLEKARSWGAQRRGEPAQMRLGGGRGKQHGAQQRPFAPARQADPGHITCAERAVRARERLIIPAPVAKAKHVEVRAVQWRQFGIFREHSPERLRQVDAAVDLLAEGARADVAQNRP